MNDSEIIDLLCQKRHKLNLTQKELAAKLEKHRSFVSKVELGNRTLTFQELKRYCLILQIDIHDLV